MNIYLDDIRKPKENFILLTNYNSFINFFKENYKDIIYISFDNDLGEEMEGYDAVKFIIDFSLDNNFELPQINVHSNNVVAIQNIKSLVDNYYKFKGIEKKCLNFIHEFTI